MREKFGRSFRSDGRHASIACHWPETVVEIDEKAIANRLALAGAQAVANGIRAIGGTSADGKHQRFVNTGTLVNGIRAQGNDVVTPPNRLADPALREKLRALVPALQAPLTDPVVKTAVTAAASTVVKAGQ